MIDNIKLFDATLRDGSHAIKHQFTAQNIREYCEKIDKAGVDVVFVGHGNGLGASSLQVGKSLLSDNEYLSIARKSLLSTKLGAYMIPGFGTIKDDLLPAIELGVDVFKIGCQCTEANVTRQHIEFLRKYGKQVYGVLMMYHMTTTNVLVQECLKMQEYGAQGVILMDSAGASIPELVKNTVSTLKDKLDIEIGFHAHNNLGLAISNTYIALQEGANIIDGTIRGFGAGAGNCALEVIVALLRKEKISLDYVNWYLLLDISEELVSKFCDKTMGIDPISIVSGVSGVFSAFKNHVMSAAKTFNVDPRDIFIELGKRKVMAGQEDMIIDVAMNLAQMKRKDDISYLVESLL